MQFDHQFLMADSHKVIKQSATAAASNNNDVGGSGRVMDVVFNRGSGQLVGSKPQWVLCGCWIESRKCNPRTTLPHP